MTNIFRNYGKDILQRQIDSVVIFCSENNCETLFDLTQSQTLSVLSREKPYRQSLINEQERYGKAVASAQKNFENACIDALKDYWNKSVEIGCDIDQSGLDISSVFSGALQDLCDSFNSNTISAGNSYNSTAIGAATGLANADASANNSFISEILSEYFMSAHAAANTIPGATGIYYNGNISIAETLANASLSNSSPLENALILKSGSAASIENAAVSGLAGNVATAYGSYTSDLISATDTAGNSAISASRSLSKEDVNNRISYLRDVVKADYDASVKRAEAKKTYNKAVLDYAADVFIIGVSSLTFEDCYIDYFHRFSDFYNHYCYYYGALTGYSFETSYYSQQPWGLVLGSSTGVNSSYYIAGYIPEELTIDNIISREQLEIFSKSYMIETATIDQELAADKAEASETYTKAYTALYREAVEKQYEIQTQILDDQISAGKSLNDSLWSACGSANAMLFESAQANDPVSDILSYLRSQSQAEIAAMVASAELYGEFQVSWRSEMLASYSAHLQENDNDNGVRLSAIESDIAWAQKVAAARNAYFAALGTATSEYNNSVIDALEAYNETVLGAEITRAKAHFDAAESYSKGSYDLEADYAKKQLDTSKKINLAALDAAIVQMVGLAELDAYYARKIADEYGTITVDDNYAEMTYQIYYDNYQASGLKRQEINDTKTATDKTNNRQARRDNNENYTEYFEAWLALQTTYEIAITTADETYYNTIIVANTNYNETVTTADKKYDEDYCRLTGQYYDTLLAINTGGTIDGNFYNNGTSSLNVQVCFPAGTPVILADGTTKNIEDILPDDLVKTVDHQKPDGTIIEGRVIRVFKNDPQPLWHLNFGSFEISATKEHPFYVKGKGWVHAEELQIGDVCRSASDTEIVLIAKEFESELVPVYNFEVQNTHTYFVGNLVEKNVLVHNECPESEQKIISSYVATIPRDQLEDIRRSAVIMLTTWTPNLNFSTSPTPTTVNFVFVAEIDKRLEKNNPSQQNALQWLTANPRAIYGSPDLGPLLQTTTGNYYSNTNVEVLPVIEVHKTWDDFLSSYNGRIGNFAGIQFPNISNSGQLASNSLPDTMMPTKKENAIFVSTSENMQSIPPEVITSNNPRPTGNAFVTFTEGVTNRMGVFTEPNKVYMHRYVYNGQAYFYFSADAKGNIPLSFVDYTPNLNKKWNISGQYILRNWLNLNGQFGH